MKTAIFIQDGLMQLVLTPESDLEKTLCKKLSEMKNVETYMGEFHECRGGYIRGYTGESSTIFVCRDPGKESP